MVTKFMHEASIASAIIKRVQEHLGSAPASIQLVKIKVGEFRNVDPESLQFAFQALQTDYTFLQNCPLEIELVKAIAICQKCASQYHPTATDCFACPFCAGGIGNLLAGEELDISGIQIIRNESKGECQHA